VVQSTTSSKPTLTCVIHTPGHSEIVGVTSVDNRLFVLRRPSQRRIQVYDLTTFKLQEQQTLIVTGLSDSWGSNGLTACVINKCVYVSDCDNDTVYQVKLTDDNKISKWSVGCGPSGLSINTACNLLVACIDDSKIQEYNTSSGSLIREICLKSNDGNLLKPLHVIQLTGGQFVVSCRDVSYVYYVVEVDVDGRVVASYTDQLQSTKKQNFSNPRQLAVDKNNECILVADHDNDRIVLLNRSLNCGACEFNVDARLRRPSCLHLDELQGRLFVGKNENSQRYVLIVDNVINFASSWQ
jgi:DNA-binding beta-propeller fold protein YncE